MEKRIRDYRRRMDELLQRDDVDWSLVLGEHLVQVGFFQHERLVHLIVTVTFAVLELLSIFMMLVSFGSQEGNPALIGLTVLIFVLLVPYIRHYYILENEVQKMYVQYDKLLEKCKSSNLRES